MAETIEKLIEEKKSLQSRFDTQNEKNKALRHKAGQVFLESIKNGASTN